MLLNHILDIVLSQLCPLVTAIVFNESPNRYYSPTFGIVPFALASSRTLHLEFSARTITMAFAGDTQLVYHCVSSGNGVTANDTGPKCVNPSSNRYQIIFHPSSNESLSEHSCQPSCLIAMRGFRIHQKVKETQNS